MVVLSSPASRERSIGEKLLIAVVILAAGDVVGKALGLIISVVRTRTLTTAEFGGLGFIVQTVGMFAQLAGFSLGLAATRYIALYRSTDLRKSQEVAQFILIFGLITCCFAASLMLIFAPQLSSAAPGLTTPMRISVLVLLSQTLSGLFLGVLIGMERFRAATIATVSQNIVMLLLTLWWAPLYGLTGTIYAMATGFFVTLGIAAWGSRDLFLGTSFNLGNIWQHRRILWEFCLPALLSSVILLPASWLSMSIVASQHGTNPQLLAGSLVGPPGWQMGWMMGFSLILGYTSGLQQLAIYFAADQLRPMLGLLTNIVAQPMMPLVTAQIKHSEDHSLPDEARETARKKAQNATLRSFQLVICLILPAHAVLAFAGPFIMAIFGKTFATEWNVFLVVLAIGAFTGVTTLLGISLQAQGRVWLLNLLLVIYGILILLFTYLFRGNGAMGLSLAYAFASIANFGFSGTILYRSRLLSLHALLLIIGTLVWLVAVSLAAAWVPEHWRIPAIPLACGLTVLVLSLVMRQQMLHVFHLVRRRLLKLQPAVS